MEQQKKNTNTRARTRQYDVVHLSSLARALIKRWWALVLAVIIGAGCGYFMNDVTVTPLYEADVLLYVNNGSISLGSTSISLSDMTASNSLVDSYIVVLNSRAVLKQVIEKADLDYSLSELKAMYSTESVDDTPALSIVVTDSDIDEAILIANTTADVLADEITRVIKGTSVEIIDYAETPEKAVTPGHLNYMERGAALAFVLCAVLLILLELMNDMIQTEDDLQKSFNYPILVTIPDHAHHTHGGYYDAYYGYQSGQKSKKGSGEE